MLSRVRSSEERSGGDAVELAGGVVLDLAVGLDLALQLDQLLGAIVDLAQALEADRPDHDQQCRDGEERREQLGLHASRHPRDQRIAHSVFVSSLVHEAQQIAPEFLRVEAHPEILYAQRALRIDNRGEKAVVHTAVFGLVREHADSGV